MPIYKKHHAISNSSDLHCSFCGKSQNKVKRLIAGPGVYICNDCVAICHEIVADSEANEYLGPKGRARDEGTAVCSFCQTVVPASQMLMVPERGQLCPECLEATRSTLDAPEEINKELP